MIELPFGNTDWGGSYIWRDERCWIGHPGSKGYEFEIECEAYESLVRTFGLTDKEFIAALEDFTSEVRRTPRNADGNFYFLLYPEFPWDSTDRDISSLRKMRDNISWDEEREYPYYIPYGRRKDMVAAWQELIDEAKRLLDG